MAYEPSAAASSQSAEIRSCRTSASTPQAVAPTTATSTHTIVWPMRDRPPGRSASWSPDRSSVRSSELIGHLRGGGGRRLGRQPTEAGAQSEVTWQVGAELPAPEQAPAVPLQPAFDPTN